MLSLAGAVLGRRADDRPLDCLARLAGYLRVWHRRSRARRMLAQVDGRMLRDLGIDPMAAQYEIAQPFWVPERRLGG